MGGVTPLSRQCTASTADCRAATEPMSMAWCGDSPVTRQHQQHWQLLPWHAKDGDLAKQS